jgi:hypothetical protein
MKNEQLNLSDFTQVDIRGGFDFEIVKSDSYCVTITRDWFKRARASKDDGTLIIDHPWYDILGWFIPWITSRAKVMMPELRGLRVSGMSKGAVTGFISSDNSKLEVRNASRLSGDISKGDAKFDVEGATRTELTGSVKELKLTKKKTNWPLLLLAIFSIFFLLTTSIFDYHSKTGLYRLSFLNKPENVFPPESDMNKQTFDKVVAFMKSDDTNKIPYGDGFNCMDATFRVFLNARWKGIAGAPIVLQYTDGTGHMVIGFSTIDKKDVFFEPQTDTQIRPRIGYDYAGKTIRGIYYLGWSALDNSPPYDPNIKPE